MKTKQSIATLLTGFLLAGCTPSAPTADTPNQQLPRFFDLPSYFQAQIDSLESDRPGLEKTLTVNGKQEVVSPENPSFREELKPFLNADINKLSWLDKYQADTLLRNEQILQTTYSATDDKLAIRAVTVQWEAGQPKTVTINSRTNNFLLKAEKNLRYESGAGYEIEQTQKMRLMKQNHIRISGQFSSSR